MNKTMVLAATVGLALVVGCNRESNAGEQPLVRVAFAGVNAWQKPGVAPRLAKLESLPATREWMGQTTVKLGIFAPQLFNFGSQTNLGATLQPLIKDWTQFGGFVEVNGTGARRQAIIATVLPDFRRAAWKQAADQLKTTAGTRLAFAQEAKWTIVATGDNAAAALAQFQKQMSAGGLPVLAGDTWLQARVNVPALASQLELPEKADWPLIEAEFSSKGEEVRVNGALNFARAVNWKPEPWRIPRATIKDPLVSFTAANGVAPWITSTKWFQGVNVDATPNQVFGWSQGNMPLLIQAAAPMNNTTGLVSELARKLPDAALQWVGQQKMGEFLWASNRAELLWQGLPIMAPHVKAVTEPAGEFLMVQLFPSAPKATNPPPELFAQVTSKPNLVYYSWEITESRIASWRQVYQLLPLFSKVPQVPLDFAGQKWLQAAASQLGNTITEVTFVSPQKMTFTRRGHLGLTGFELVQLSRALDLWGMPPDFGVLKRPAAPPAKAPKAK